MNKKIASKLNEIAFLMDLDGDNSFKVSAFKKAALTVESLSTNIGETGYEDLKGIGKSCAQVIEDLISNNGNTCNRLEDLHKRWPASCMSIMKLQGIGPVKARTLISAGFKSLEDLSNSLKNGELISKVDSNIYKLVRDGIEYAMKSSERIPWPVVDGIVKSITNWCKDRYKAENDNYFIMQATGSYRRLREDCGDIDLVITTNLCTAPEFFEAIKQYPGYEKTLSAKDTKAITIINENQVDFLFVDKEKFGATILFYTGSKELNIEMAKRATAKGYHLGRFEGLTDSSGQLIATTEEEIFAKLDMPYLLPEHREERFLNISEADYQKILSELVELKDLKGDLHTHSWSDGTNSLEEMRSAASNNPNYLYLGISDHSESLKIAGGLTEERLLQQMEAINKLNSQGHKIKLLKGIECEFKHGELDYFDQVREQLDYVIASIHNLKGDQTDQLMLAINEPTVNIIAHPMGRHIGKSPGRETDWDRVLALAVAKQVALEINCQPDRLDLGEEVIRKAVAAGCYLTVNTDSHIIDTFRYMKYGVNLLRRCCVPRSRVLNCLDASLLIKFFNKESIS